MKTSHVPLFALVLVACGPKSTAEPTADPTTEAAADAPTTGTPATPALDANTGGRLFDKWYADASFDGSFKADDKSTPDADGSGGPNGNGTLNDGSGKPVLNTGHGYRLKNLFGWDLRGTAGIYGASYQNKSTAIDVNLLEDSRDAAAIAAWLKAGDDKVPAYGDVLSDAHLAAIADFIVGVRDKTLPHPDDVFALSADAPKNYTLAAGADLQAGAEAYGKRCAGCHGKDGNNFPLEGLSLGNYARAKAYEAWFKIASGQPGTKMGSQASEGKMVLSILAALCDRKAFPAADTKDEVPDGDPRCGAYLK